jgi:pSer/pThr/pTyr-binding forkhead associated (FHA) protein
MRISYTLDGRSAVFDRPGARITVGRRTRNNVVDLDLSLDEEVSRLHACIWADEEGRYWAEDRGSKHGTFVAGKDLRGQGAVALALGTELRVGQTTLVLLPERPRDDPETREEPEARVTVTVDGQRGLNYSLLHAGVPLLAEITLTNETDVPLRDVRVELTLPGYVEFATFVVADLPAKGQVTVAPPDRVQFHNGNFKTLTEPEPVALVLRVNGQRGRLSAPFEVSVLPPQAWYGMDHRKVLACFVIPNAAAVDGVVARARSRLPGLLPGTVGFVDALESSRPEACQRAMEALYETLRSRNIVYEYEPRNYGPGWETWQRVRFHGEVMHDREGTCIDLALLFAACLENVLFDPLIIIVATAHDVWGRVTEQHAVMGCWRHGSPEKGKALLAEQEVRDAVAAEELIVLDSMGFPRTHEHPAGRPFTDAATEGDRYLKQCPVVFAIDVVRARGEGGLPMPFGREQSYDRAVWAALFQARREAAALRSGSVGTRHLLLGLLGVRESLLRQVFDRLGPDVVDRVTEEARKSVMGMAPPRYPLAETQGFEAVLAGLEAIGSANRGRWATEADLIEALLQKLGTAEKILSVVGVTRQQCQDALGALRPHGGVLSEWHESESVAAPVESD